MHEVKLLVYEFRLLQDRENKFRPALLEYCKLIKTESPFRFLLFMGDKICHPKVAISPTNLYPVEIISGCDIVFISQVKDFTT